MVMCKGYNTESRVFTTLSRELAASMVFSACSNSTAPMAASPTQVWPTQAVNIWCPDRRKSGCKHLLLTRTPMKLVVDRRSGKTGCWLDCDIFVSQALRIISTLFTFTEENKTGIDQVTWKHSLTVIPQSPNEYKKLITKLDNHFIPMVNPDCALSKLEKMCQNEGESIARYHIR